MRRLALPTSYPGESLLGSEIAEALGLPRDSARTIATHGLRAEIEAGHPKT